MFNAYLGFDISMIWGILDEKRKKDPIHLFFMQYVFAFEVLP